MSMTIGKKIGTGFAAVVALLAIMGAIALLSVRTIGRTTQVIGISTDTLQAMNQCAVERRDFAIKGTEADAQGKTAADRWQASYEEMAEGLRSLQGSAELPAEQRVQVDGAVGGLGQYAAAFQAGVKSFQDREAAFKVWSGVGWSFTELIQKLTENEINPAWKKAVEAKDAAEIEKWSQINIALDQEVIQPFLLLRVNAVYLIATRADAQWQAFQKQMQVVRDGIAAWSQRVKGNAELERVIQQIDEQIGMYAKA